VRAPFAQQAAAVRAHFCEYRKADQTTQGTFRRDPEATPSEAADMGSSERSRGADVGGMSHVAVQRRSRRRGAAEDGLLRDWAAGCLGRTGSARVEARQPALPRRAAAQRRYSHARTHGRSRSHTPMHKRTCKHTHAHARTHSHAHACTALAHSCTQAHTARVQKHAHKHTRSHTHTHARALARALTRTHNTCLCDKVCSVQSYDFLPRVVLPARDATEDGKLHAQDVLPPTASIASALPCCFGLGAWA
jgi:hypothetical protein